MSRIIPRLVVVALTCIICSSCCDRTAQYEKYSPSGMRVARVMLVNCGALSDYATEVDVYSRGVLFWHKAQPVVGVKGRHLISLDWKGDNVLIVHLPNSALPRDFTERKIDFQESDVDGVHIEYTF